MRLKWELPTSPSQREDSNRYGKTRTVGRIPAGSSQEARPWRVQEEAVKVYTAEDEEKRQEGAFPLEVQESKDSKNHKNGKITEIGPRLVIESDGPVKVVVPVPAPPPPDDP